MHPAEQFLQALGKERATATERDFARFFAKVTQNGDCLEWGAANNGLGYGIFWFDGARRYAHRFAYEQFIGEIGWHDVCHACDNPKCVNPQHLFLGDRRTNMADASDKGRIKRGAKHYKSLLTESDVRQIRARWQSGESSPSIAKDYPHHYRSIWAIATRNQWRHVK